MSEGEGRTRKVRWRLVLGEGSEQALGVTLEGEQARQDRALGYLYGREYGPGRNVRGGVGGRSGGRGPSSLTTPEWINEVHELFPRKTIERIEKDALERYGLEELVTSVDMLQRAEPNMTLLKAVLRTKHLMNQDVLAMARLLVTRVIEDLLAKLSRPVLSPFTGARSRTRTPHRSARNFDPKDTIRRNLAHYDPQQRRLFIEDAIFKSRVRRRADRWKVVVLVDASGSMLGSAIHAAVTAAIFAGLRSVTTHLVMFDTEVVDLTDRVQDPVEALLSVQLGGGTDIAHAVAYGESLIDDPRRTIVVLISDFFEGGSAARLIAHCKRMIESGVRFLGLAALDEQANPNYDRVLAGRLAKVGAKVGAMTPGELAEWVAEVID